MYRKTIILSALLLALSMVFIFQETRQVRRNTIEVATIPEGVDAVTIARGDEELRLHRDGGGWLVGAEAYPASEEGVADFIDAVRGVREAEVISGRSNYSQYDLTGAAAYEVSFEQEGTEVLTLTLGADAAAGGAVYGRINSRPQVVLLPRRIKELVSLDPTEYREKTMAAIERSSITGAVVTGESYGTFSLTPREPEEELSEESTELEELDARWQVEGPEDVAPGRIRNFLQELEELVAQDFPEVEPQGAPFATVTVNTTGGEERFEIYPPTEENLYPVTATTTEYTFLLADWRARRLLLGTPQFFEPFQEGEE